MVLSKEFYTVQELAELLQVTRMTIYRLERSGKLKGHHIGRAKRYRREDIEDYLKTVRE